MEASFWHKLWEADQTGWHLEDTHQLLLRHYSSLNLQIGSRVFVPLCGKTLDIQWLLDKGCRVVAIELNENAVRELFEFLDITPTVSQVDSLKLYSAKDIDIFVGDFFELRKDILGDVDAVYDRGALVALPKQMRKDYTSLLLDITNKADQLVICFDYDQRKVDGPPFSITNELLKDYYGDIYSLTLLESLDVSSGFERYENIWLLNKSC